jgi:hypothetical protein
MRYLENKPSLSEALLAIAGLNDHLRGSDKTRDLNCEEVFIILQAFMNGYTVMVDISGQNLAVNDRQLWAEFPVFVTRNGNTDLWKSEAVCDAMVEATSFNWPVKEFPLSP